MNITGDLVSGTKSSESPSSGRTGHSTDCGSERSTTSPNNQQQQPTNQTIPSAKFCKDDLDHISDDYMKLREKLDEYKCPICMDILVKTSMISCGHRFCLYCIKQWFHHSFPRRFCPVCRKNCIYYQDDVDTDVSISNIYHRLTPPEQEERNMILLDREYLSTLPMSRMPEQNVYFDGFVDELSQSWANQYYTDFITSPFEFEPMNPIMTETYYPPFHHYGSYEEAPFSGYQERPNGPTSPQLPPPPQSIVDPPQPTSVDAMCFHPAANNYLSPPPPPQMTKTSVAVSALGLNFSRGPGDFLPQPSGPGGNIGPFGYLNEDYHTPDGAPQPLAGNLELPMDPNLPLWTPQNYDGPSRTLPYDSMNHVPPHLMDTYNHYTDVRSNIQPTFRIPEATNMNWNGGQDPNEWHLMSGPQDSWTFPGNSLHNPSPIDSQFYNKSVIPTPKSIKKLFSSHNYNNTTTHEDYQQDVLIQEEFQRLDEMLLRDDDLSLSDVDQVSVESVVSSEQQYDSPWEAITEHRQQKQDPKDNNKAATILENEPEKSPPIKTTEGTEPSTVNTASTSTRIAAVVEESRQNSQQVIMHSSQQEQRKAAAAQQQQAAMLSHMVGKTTAVRTYTATTTTTIQSVEALKKPFRLKTATATIEIPQQQHFTSQFQPQSQQPRRLTEIVSTPTPQPRILEQKRTIGRIRMDQARVTDRPAVQNFKPYQPLESIMMTTTSQPAPLPIDFRTTPGVPMPTRRTTPRLPRIRMDARRLPQSPQPTQVLKRKPLSMSPPGSSGTESSPSSPGRNMMGISQGDGVWGPVPEMNARMYLPHGVLLFKMEYQPHGSSPTSFSPRKHEQEASQQAQGQSQQQQQQQQQSSQQSRSQVLTNLAKFTHPVIHMLPLSADGSTRLNVTFDVIYQN